MHKICIDNFIFHVNVTEYYPAIPGSYDKSAASDYDYFGYPESLEWGCDTVIESHDGSLGYAPNTTFKLTGDDALEIVDAYAEQITEKLLEKMHFEQECAEEIYV